MGLPGSAGPFSVWQITVTFTVRSRFRGCNSFDDFGLQDVAMRRPIW